MRLKHYINEEWAKNRGGEKFEILLNPSKKEMRDLTTHNSSKLRFILDNENKDYWVWKASKGTHYDIWRQVSTMSKGRDYFEMVYGILPGICDLNGGKWVMIDCDKIDYGDDITVDVLQEYYDKSKWVNRYIKVDDYFKRKIRVKGSK